MKIVFLDIDGVLNSQPDIARGWYLSNAKCALLNDLLKSDDAIHFVISSSWRKIHDLSKITFALRMCGVRRCRVIGKTLSLRSGFRGDEVEDWLKKNRLEKVITHWAILDDDSDFHDYQKPSLVKTKFDKGLKQKHIDKLKEILEVS